MKYLFNSVTELVSPEIIFQTALDLGESKNKVSSAVQMTIASLLDVLVEQGESKKLELILKGMGLSNSIHDISGIFGEEISFNKHRVNARFLNFLLKDKIYSFYSTIASSSGISRKSAQKITSRISVLLAVFLGEKLISGVTLSNILEQLEDERVNFQLYIPLEMTVALERTSSKPFLVQKLWTAFF